MKKFILAAFAITTLAAVLPTGALADTACTVTVTKFHQSYPYSGKATVEYTVGGALPVGAFAEITINTDGASATFTQNNIVAGANTNVIDFASSFGGALVLSNASFVVTIKPGDDDLGGVQLWANGPYWAECNVGASEPEECGYYFYWGDTVGYTWSGGTWTDFGEGEGNYDDVTWVSSTGEQLSGSPFSESLCPTYGNNSQLQSAGYIDATGNLVAAHDAATAHLGAPWRMPTDAEFSALINNCTTTWITTNGISGRLVTGKGAYANRSIFLPAAGVGGDLRLYYPGSYGYYWSSTPSSGSSDYAWYLYLDSGFFYRYYYGYRENGQSVRPVRGFAGCSASGVVTRDPVTVVIESVADWDALSAAVAGGLETEGVLVLLANDVGPVTNMVGDAGHPFAGVFNGNGHTLTVAISGTGDCVAPFSVIDGAMISNLVVTGTISGGNHSAGLVGTCGATGPNVIRDCTVSVAVSGTGYLGGIVGHGGQGTLSFEGCVFSGAVSGFSAFAGGLMGWSNSMALNVTNCLSAGTFAPAGGGAYHPIACKRANQTVTATVADAYWINTVVPTTVGGNLIPGAEGAPVSATLVVGAWAQPVTAADGNTYYAWTSAPAGRLLARYSFDDAGNGGLNLLHAAVGQDAIVRATQTTPVAGIGDIAAVTDAAILSGLAAGDGAVAVTNGQYLAVPIPAPLLTAHGRPYTVVMKIRVPNTRGWRSLVNMPASNDTDAMIYLQESTRNIYLKQFNKASGYGVGAANGFVPAEQWATITFAFGENATDVYLDGTAVLHRTDGTLAGSYADCAAAGGYILVGADDSGDDELFHLSEFRIYEGAASAAVHLLLPGSGTPADPYVISSTADWNTFASNVCVGVEAAACYRLAADISVTETVGPQDHPFRGTFNGGGHTLTANLSGTDAYLAPFSAINGVTISNLVVAGTVAGNMHCSGLVGCVAGGSNTIADCKVGAAISSSGTHFGGFVGHGLSAETTLCGCVFSGSLTGDDKTVGTFMGWSDDGSATTLIDCLDASASTHPIGRGEGAACVSNTYYFASKDFSNGDRLWSEGKRGKRAYTVTGDDGVTIDFGAPSATYGTAGIAAYAPGLAYRGSGTPAASSGTFYAAQGDAVRLDLAATTPSSMVLDAYEARGWEGASAGTISQSGSAWTLTMPAEDVIISATFADLTAYYIWAAANGVAGAWDATDASGIHNVFRYAFNVPTGAFTNPPLLDIAIEGNNAVVITPPVSNKAGFAVSVVESSDVAGATVTRRKPLDATGRTVFPMESAASRFYRLSVTLGTAHPDGVQLWAGGPYWAECNVGASRPEEYGYYFWWGDTVGYTRSGGAWDNDFKRFEGVTWVSSTGQTMGSSPFSSSSCPTYRKDISALRSVGWIDYGPGNLAPEYDAATVHLGAPWRMPTVAEHGDLLTNCDWTWTTKNGVNGYKVRGRYDYASNSIFLPAAGRGNDANFEDSGSLGNYWSSTPNSVNSYSAYYLQICSSYFDRFHNSRFYGLSVRPVRDAD